MSPREEGADAPGQDRRVVPLDAAWRNALTKQNVLDLRKAVVEDLRRQLDKLCSDIVQHGNNAERVYQVRMLDVSLAQARRQLEQAHSQLDDTIRQLRRVHGGKRKAGSSAGDQAALANGNE
jgi:outer membrane protein TolC